MKIKCINLTCSLLFLINLCYGQVNISFTNPSIVGEKWRETELIIPIEAKIKNTTQTAVKGNLTLTLDNTLSNLTAAELANIEIRNNPQNIQTLQGNEEITKTFYVTIKKDAIITSNKNLNFDIKFNGVKQGANIVTIKRGNDLVYKLNDYLSNPELRLNFVTNVESKNNILTLYGIRGGNITKINVMLGLNEVIAINEWSYFGNSFHWKPLPISLTTIPLKIRPERTVLRVRPEDPVQGTYVLNTTASAGLENIGINLDLGKYQMDRYFTDGKKSTHKLGLGFWAAPSVEELDSVQTLGYLKNDNTTKQLFVSTGITISYSYNGISFIFVPAGWDFSTSTIGKEWVYDEKRWWGFGLAVSPKIFETILNGGK